MAIPTRSGTELIEAISDWVRAGKGLAVGLGPDVLAASERARGFLRDLRLDYLKREIVNQNDIDILYAASRLLSAEVAVQPAAVFGDGTRAWELLERSTWDGDEFGERDELLCSLAFVCWRAGRLLDLPHRKYQWEIAYRLAFRRTLQWDVIASTFLTAPAPSMTAGEVDPERIYQALVVLQETCDSTPYLVASRAEALFSLLKRIRPALPPDLAPFFVGTTARIAGAAKRLCGASDEAFEWLDVADASMRGGICSGPELARVSYQRLAVLYGLGRFDIVDDAMPTLEECFAAFGMREDYVKCRILWASSLKISGRCPAALELLEPLRHIRHEISAGLFGRVLLELGDIYQIEGDCDRGLAELNEAAALLTEGNHLTGLADVASMLGAAYRARGKLREALTLFEKGREAYSRLGMQLLEAYMRILLAETHLAMGKPLEAERQVLVALPTLKGQHMVAEVTAGIGILQEAAKRRRMDPAELREVVRDRRPKRT